MFGKLQAAGWVVLFAAVHASAETPGSAEADAFFETRVRPILAENCFQCHGKEKQKAGLRVDSRESLLRGGESGPAILMADLRKSPVLVAVRQESELKMPPRGKLPEEAIQALTHWVELGAPWPGSAAPEARLVDRPPGEHWAFRPISSPPVPRAQLESWAETSVDHFILARLEAVGLQPRPEADRRTLLRRLSLDLTGLPPSLAEVESFEASREPDAYAREVDRLLLSPRHGERWGRHWLDVARYADTKGYVFEEERRYPYSYTYRDYVIRAFNEDKPYDRFVVEQLAADLLPPGNDPGPLAAMGFLTLGRRFLNNTADIIDDRLDVVCRGVMGLTVTCARCHDHKYDPIPTADYYALYGVLASSSEPAEAPLVGVPEESAAYAEYQKQLGALEADVARLIAEKREEVLAEARRRTGEYLLAAARPDRAPREQGGGLAAGDLHPAFVARWREFLAAKKQGFDSIFTPWLALLEVKDGDGQAARFREAAAAAARSADPAKPIHPLVARALGESPPDSLEEAARRLGELFAAGEKQEGDQALGELHRALVADGAPGAVPADQIEKYFDRAIKSKVRDLRKKVDSFKASSPAAPPRAMSLKENEKPFDPVIFVRGNPNNRGKPVTRHMLGLVDPERKPFVRGSGRLELAEAIASPQNPLTARVISNRVWMLLLGKPLVSTPGDFGTRSDPPTHPELLDHLATTLIESGWSLKSLVRTIVLSSVYRQDAEESPEGRRLDPENRLLWRQNRSRADFEALRDSILHVAGRIDTKMGGPATDILKQPFSGRRSVYAYIDRQNLPGLFRSFDFASPDVSTPARHETTVPQQALFLMNSPFVVEQARFLAAREEVALRRDPAGKVEALYGLALARRPDPEETRLAVAYLEGEAPGDTAKLSRVERLAQTLLLSNELAVRD